MAITAITFSQNEASNWFFGENAGITFNLNAASISNNSNGRLYTREGCASISDENGNLLFYTDGTTVYNGTHQIMQNGTGLLGDESSTQSAIVVPKPDNPNIYYIFTVGSSQRNTGLNYSTVDMTLDSGRGGIVSKNNSLLELCSEKITAVLKDCITKSIWVVTFASKNGLDQVYDTFHAFEVNNSGVNTSSVTSTFEIVIGDARGYLKLSPDGTKVACANVFNGLYIYDFDTNTGQVTNQVPLTINTQNDSRYPYGVEFSPSSELLYVHASNDYFNRDDIDENDNPDNHTSILIQYDLTQPDIQNSQVTIDNRNLYRGALQLGPDGKIYRALSSTYDFGLSYLGAINNPNARGLSCNYVHNAVNLAPNKSSQGLPPFISSFFNSEIDIIKNGESTISLNLCTNDLYTLSSIDILGATYTWTKDNITLPETGFELVISEAGHYQVYIDPQNGDCAFEGQAFVNYNAIPIANNHILFQCDEDGINDGITMFNLNEANNVLTNGEPETRRFTKFYSDIKRTTEINAANYPNTSNPQTVYVEVYDSKSLCMNTSELILEVSVTSANNVVLPPVCDDDGIEDGLYEFNLKSIDPYVLNGLPAGLDLKYYESYNDALLETNEIVSTYRNRTAYSQTIYARVENTNNCYGISEVLLTVNKLPDIETEATAYYCLNKYPERITIDAGIINDSPNNYTYKWSTGEDTYDIQVNQTGTYDVVITNNNGCSKTRTITIIASNIASFEAIEIKDASSNNSVSVITTGDGLYEYALYDENNLLIMPYQSSNLFENVKPGFYTVYVKDIKNNCGIVTNKISVIGFPKVFTPNNDGYNDFWQVYGVSNMFHPDTKILIYNRLGKLLKELSPKSKGWDGQLNGEKLPADDYWFWVKLQDGRVFNSHFTLKR